MPDGAATQRAPHGHEADARLLRRVRWQLIAWSAGSTLLVLVVLGSVLYAAAASTLASASETQLRDRAALVVQQAVTAQASPVIGRGLVAGGAGTTTGLVQGAGAVSVVGVNAALPGFAIGGPYSGTLAIVLPVESTAIVGAPADPPVDPEGFSIAAAGGTSLRETTYAGSPVRILSVPVPTTVPGAVAGVLQVVGDRTAELRTLGVLVMVLLGGGVAALVVAGSLGWLYATRALVPIRASLRRQREFAADTSHELRTPLAVIRAGVARVRQQPEARVLDVEPALDAVDQEAIRLGALVDDLLALARTDSGGVELDLQAVDLAEVAAEAMVALEPLAARRSVRLMLDVEPSLGRGDVARLRRLVTVLVDNAIRHGHAGGRVLVTVRPGSLVVDDDGPGVPADALTHVFDRFWRGAGAPAGGSGLGLAIAAWIAERHDGRITVGDSPLGGARFAVTLPTRAGFTMAS